MFYHNKITDFIHVLMMSVFILIKSMMFYIVFCYFDGCLTCSIFWCTANVPSTASHMSFTQTFMNTTEPSEGL